MVAQFHLQNALFIQQTQELVGHKPPVGNIDVGQLQMGFQTSQQFLLGNGFREVVIGSGVETLHQVFHLVFGREHQNRQLVGGIARSQLLGQLIAGHFRHHHIHQHHIGLKPLLQNGQGSGAVVSGHDFIFFLGQEIFQHLKIHRLIVHHQDFEPLIGLGAGGAGLGQELFRVPLAEGF